MEALIVSSRQDVYEERLLAKVVYRISALLVSSAKDGAGPDSAVIVLYPRSVYET